MEIKSAEGMSCKLAAPAYRCLSKEEKDVYIEMERKAKIQYQRDLESYILSLPSEEQKTYSKKLKNSKRKRATKQTVKPEIDKLVKPDDLDDIDDDSENGEQYAAMKIENSVGEPSNTTSKPSPSKSNSFEENPKDVAAKSKATVKNSKAQPLASIFVNKNSRKKAAEPQLIDDNSISKPMDNVIEVETQLQKSRKKSASRKRKSAEIDDDEVSSMNSSVSLKSNDKPVKKKRRTEETKSGTDDLDTQITEHVTEPERISE